MKLRFIVIAILGFFATVALTSCGGGGGGGSATPASTLVAYWPADGNYDDTVNGNNGTPFGGVTFAAGEKGQAFSFDGSSGRVFIPDSASLALTHSLAFTAWINPAAYTGQSAMIFFRGDDRVGYDPYSFFLDGTGHLGFDISDQFNNNTDVISTNPVPLNTWTFVACSLDDSTGTMNVYINGALAGSNTTSFRPYGPLDPLANPGEGIGNVESGNYSFYFNGLIDELKVYNFAAPAALAPSAIPRG